MFGFLKDKLKKTIDNIADKFRKKPEERKEEPEKDETIKERKEREIKDKKEKRIEEIKEKVKEEPKSFFQKIKDLGKTRLDESDFSEFFENLELVLMENNVALEVIENIKSKMKSELLDKPISRGEIRDMIKSSLKKALEGILMNPFDFLERVKTKKPFVIAFFGINGVGKTTAISKIANLLKKNKLSVVLAASDTFRAAAIQQLKEWGEKLNLKVIAHDYGSDPAAVAFDAISYAKAHNIDVVLIDTAGRLHSNEDLMREMQKIVRVTKPDLKLFIAESITGNDAVLQAKEFDDSIGIDGIILTKSDVDEKGGTAISISYVTKKPVFYIGVGQLESDLKPFNKELILKTLNL